VASTGTAYLDVKPNLDGFQREMSGSKFSGIGKKAGLALAAGVGVGIVALGKLVKDSLGAAQEAVEAEAQTAAVIKSTGAAANVSNKQIGELTTRIMGYSAIQDETIREGANMLLTFKNIRNEVGQNNDIFTQATEITTDLSVALGKDMRSSAMMVGKALNDPIAGMTALGRAGVQFTEEQKTQIETMIESGKTLDAQKLILKELEVQVGGSAKAVGDTKPWDKFKNAVGEVQESIGKALLPTINDMADDLSKFVASDEFQKWVKDLTKWLRDELPGAMDKAGNALAFIKDHIKEIGGAIGVLGVARIVGPFARLAASFTTIGASKTGVTGAVGGLKGMAGSLSKAVPAMLAVTEGFKLFRNIEREGVMGGLAAQTSDYLDKVKGLATSLTGGGDGLAGALSDTTAASIATNGKFTEMRDRLERIQGPLEAYEQGVLDNLLAQGRWGDALKQLRGYLEAAEKKMKPFSDAMERAQREVGETGGKVEQLSANLRGIPPSKNVRINVDAAQAQADIDETARKMSNLKDLFGEISGFHFIPKPRAMGGPVFAKTPYIVGEKGPELFVPSTSGRIRTHEDTTRILSRGPRSTTATVAAGNTYVNLTQNIMGEYDPEEAAMIAAMKVAEVLNDGRIRGIRA
jgi:hypothetical protein